MADPVVFALSPALVNNEVIDYSTAEGVKLYKSNISKLPVEITASPEDLVLTLQEIRSRVESANWLAIMTIPVENDANGAAVTRNLITEHGMITMEQVRAHALTYAETQTRDAQNAVQMYSCLAESFTKEAKIKLRSDLDLARVGPTGIPNGPLLLKLFIVKSTTDTRSTMAYVRRNLATLDLQMKKLGNNIEKFNDYVKLQMNDLSARGSTIDDAYIVTNLFLAYLSVDDKTFHSYITKQQDDYNDNEKDFNVQSLMGIALNKYKTLVESDQWEAPTADSQIVALTARLTTLEKKKSAAVPKKAAGSNGEPKKTKKKKGTSDFGKNDKKWAWKDKAPKKGDPKTKKVDGKTYHWCHKHEAWTLHAPADCRKGVPTNSDNALRTAENESTSKKSSSDKVLQLSSALVSIIEDDEE